MSTRISRPWWPLLGATILLAVLIAGCTAPSGPTPPVTTLATPAPTSPPVIPPATIPATTVATTPLPAGTTPVDTTAMATTMTTPPTTPVPPAPVAVTIENFLFSPASVTVPKGTMVTWTNRDSVPHSIISDMSGKFSSPTFGAGGTFSFTFTEPGTYPYHCGIHTTMHGTVIVT